MDPYFVKKLNNYKFELIKNENYQAFKSADEIVEAMKRCRNEIAEYLEILEEIIAESYEKNGVTCEESEKQMAVLLRQDQYLEYLLSKQKYELAEIFLDKKDESDDESEILNWYQPDNETNI